jgi:hypothetical protein
MQNGDLIRFVTNERHPPYGHRTGVFQAAFDLWTAQKLVESEQSELRALLDWFNTHLTSPSDHHFVASRRPHAKTTGISWLRASAHDHVRQLRRIVSLVQEGGIVVTELRTTRPGYILYEDRCQVIAVPFADTPS